jgi:hypothetical protein
MPSGFSGTFQAKLFLIAVCATWERMFRAGLRQPLSRQGSEFQCHLLFAVQNLVSVLESVGTWIQCYFVLLYAIFSTFR